MEEDCALIYEVKSWCDIFVIHSLGQVLHFFNWPTNVIIPKLKYSTEHHVQMGTSPPPYFEGFGSSSGAQAQLF
jgi:hypothetical protein